MRKVIFFILTFFCTGIAFTAENEKLHIMTAIPPLAYLVERIGGDQVKVDVLLGPGKEPHTYDPTPRQVALLSKADIYFSIGFPFEERLLEKLKTQNISFIFIKADRGIEKISLQESIHDLHVSEGRILVTPDPHIWLSPLNLKIMAENIYNAISEFDNENRNLYQNNLKIFLQEIEAVHRKLITIFAPLRGSSFFVFHPAFGYFAETYGLKQIPVEIKGKNPSPRQIEELIKVAREKKAGAVFISPQFNKKSAKIISDAVGVPLFEIDPLEKEVLKNLIEIGEKIELSLKSERQYYEKQHE